jgi:arylsulfatase A-like enzyme
VHPFFDWGAYLDGPQTTDYKVAQKTIELIRESKNSKKPFFISAGFFSTHCPLYAPQRWFDLHPIESIPALPDQAEDMKDISPYAHKLVSYHGKQKYNKWIQKNGLSSSIRQAYRACVSHTDSCVGMVLDALKEAGLEDNTIVVFASDHGVQNGQKNMWYKRTLWEATAHVPLLIKVPKNSRSLRVDVPVGMIDIYPTLCDLANLPHPEGLEGLSLTGLMTQRKGAEIRQPVLTSHGPGNFALRDSRWRFIRYADGSEELYDHKVDPNEHTNLSKNPEYESIIAKFLPFIPKTSSPFVVGSKGLGSGAFPDK